MLPEYTVAEPGICAFFYRNRYRVPRVRELFDFLVMRFREASHEWLDRLPGQPVQQVNRQLRERMPSKID